MRNAPASDTMRNAVQLLAIGAVGAAVALLLRIPAAWMTGPMLSVSVAKLAGWQRDKAPTAYSEVGKVLLGTVIGATFHRSILAQLGSLLAPAMLATLAMIAAGLALAWTLARYTDVDLGTALFSLTPGGMAEMVAVAEEIEADLAVVATLQFVRYTCVVLLAPVIVDGLF